LTCHVPHGSHNDKLLAVKLPMLCQRCHALSGHNNSAYDASQVATQQNRVADKACVNCHIMIHGSNHPSGKFFQR
jgi:predicted CXXCH cytochrome family protein